MDINAWRRLSKNTWTRYAKPFAGAYLLTLIVYSYFFTTIIFTDHTFPDVWVFNYPSYKTTHEGRWFSDIIWQLMGGSGVQAFQMALATGLQIINAFLLTSILRVSNKLHIFLAAAFLALHPAFLDYYSFSIEHVPLTLGDTLALLGIVALDCVPDRRLGIALGILCFVLTLAIYQPKIALVALLVLIWCVQGTSQPLDRLGNSHAGRSVSRMLVGRMGIAVFAFVTALALYYFSAKLIITPGAGFRTRVNDLDGILQLLRLAYPETLANFTKRVDYLPRIGIFVPAFGIVLGIVALARQAWHVQKVFAIYVLALIALFPVALQLSYIINDQTWRNVGRILSPHAYCLLFFLASAWSVPKCRHLAILLLSVLVYCFCIVGSQETNTAAMKDIFDIAKINRIVARVENVESDLYQRRLPVVVVGALSLKLAGPLRKYPNQLYRAHITNSESFAVYRQIEILNFFLGQRGVTRPNKMQVDAALTSQKGRRPWPAPESVYMQDGVIVVLLQSYGPDVPVTWSHD